MWRRVCSFMRAPRRTKDDSEIEGWSIRRWPTPGRPASTGMPMSLRCPTGPMPARSRCAGEWIAPEERMTSRPRNSCSRPSTSALTPTQRVPSNSSSLTCVSVEIVRLARLRVVAIEIAHRGRDALLVLVGMRHREIAVDELAVLVGQELEAGLLAGLGHRLRMLGPVLLAECGGPGCGHPCRGTARRNRGRARPS